MQYLTDFRCCDIAVIGYRQNLFDDIINCSKDIVAHSPGKSQDRPAYCSINAAQKVTFHHKMRCIQKQQVHFGCFCLLHQRLKHILIKYALFPRICFAGKEPLSSRLMPLFLTSPRLTQKSGLEFFLYHISDLLACMVIVFLYFLKDFGVFQIKLTNACFQNSLEVA